MKRKGCAACRASEFVQWRVRLWRVHAEAELVVSTQVPSRSNLGRISCSVMNEERVRSNRESTVVVVLIVVSCIPDHASRLFNRHIRGDRVCSLVETACSEDVDGGWCIREAGIVPFKSDIVANFVILRACSCSRGDEFYTTGR